MFLKILRTIGIPNLLTNPLYIFKEMLNIYFKGYSNCLGVAKSGNAIFHITNANTYDYEEIFRDNVYGVTIKNQTPLIIDVGASIGDSTIFFTQKYPSSRIIALEPNEKTFDILHDNISINNITNVYILNSGLVPARYNVQQKLYLHPIPPLSSYINNYRNLKSKNTKTITLNQLIKSVGGDAIDLLKIDIEGLEYRLLPDLIAHRDKIKQFIIELHIFNNSQDFIPFIFGLHKYYKLFVTSQHNKVNIVSGENYKKGILTQLYTLLLYGRNK